MVAPHLLFITGLSTRVVFVSLCGSCGSGLNSKAYLATTLHSVCMAPIPRLLPTWQGSEAQGPGPAGCSILCQACDKQTQVVLHPVPMADFTSNFMQLEVTNLTLGIYPPGVIKSILFQTVAVLF